MSESIQEIVSRIEAITGDLNYRLGWFDASVEALADAMHTCAEARYRFPWPPDQNCPACVRELERHVARTHSEMAYRLFGWDAMVDSMDRAINIKIAQRDAHLMQGAYI